MAEGISPIEGHMTTRFGTIARTALVAGLVTVLAAPIAQARPGGGKSSGSRGSSTFSAPPPTATAPRPGQPIQRTETPSAAPARPGMAAPAQPSRGFGGLGAGLAAGLLGAGLFGMLSGNGFMGGIAGLASIMGFLLQIALIAGLVWLAFRFFRRRSEPAMAGGPSNHGRSPLEGGGQPGGFPRAGFGGGGGGAPARQPIEIGPQDYQAFERNLGEVQTSYGRGDVGALRRLATPEMARYLEEDLAHDRGRGVRNEVSEPKLLQGDLAEAWREGTTEYATVAMRYEIVDVFVDTASGRIVEGNRGAASEVTEIWTFRRDMKGAWLLSAIQQTA